MILGEGTVIVGTYLKLDEHANISESYCRIFCRTTIN